MGIEPDVAMDMARRVRLGMRLANISGMDWDAQLGQAGPGAVEVLESMRAQLGVHGPQLLAVRRYALTATVTVPAGTASASDQFGTVSYAGPGTLAAWAEGFPVTFQRGQVIELDPATTAGAALQSAIGAGNLRAYVQGTDDVGRAGMAN